MNLQTGPDYNAQVAETGAKRKAEDLDNAILDAEREALAEAEEEGLVGRNLEYALMDKISQVIKPPPHKRKKNMINRNKNERDEWFFYRR